MPSTVKVAVGRGRPDADLGAVVVENRVDDGVRPGELGDLVRGSAGGGDSRGGVGGDRLQDVCIRDAVLLPASTKAEAGRPPSVAASAAFSA